MTEKEALKLALEALENTTPTGFNMERDKQFFAAITAIKEALAQPELTLDGLTPTEFALRELYEFQEATGCDTAAEFKAQTEQEPVAWLHTKIEGVAVPHRPADLDKHPDRWEALYKTPPPCPTCEALARTVILDQTSHDTTPPQSEQGYTITRNPWTGKATHKCNACGRNDFRSEHAAKFHECQEQHVATSDTSQERVDETSKQRHEAQPEQEPVAWRYRMPVEDGHWVWNYATYIDDPKDLRCEPLYTTPPQPEPVIDKSAAVRIATALGWEPKRTWVGLTDEERRGLREWQKIQEELGPVWAPMMLYLYDAIEAKLKEKNT